MRVLAHLSDIHFGTTDPVLVAAVQAHLAELAPDYTVISGDLTQRARSEEFQQARAFIDALPGEKIVVPGNHDVPLWNVFARFISPLSGYLLHITQQLLPRYRDDEVAIIGLNTARSWTRKNGRVNEEQVEDACRWLSEAPEGLLKIVVTHHPFDLSAEISARHLVGRASMGVKMLAGCGVSILLAGHYHQAYTGGTAHRHSLGGYSALIVQAGTATSKRLRGSPNSFNILRLDAPHVQVEMLAWDAAARRFTVRETKRYLHDPKTGFTKLEPGSAPAGHEHAHGPG